jgi:hypothetical protein
MPVMTIMRVERSELRNSRHSHPGEIHMMTLVTLFVMALEVEMTVLEYPEVNPIHLFYFVE